MGNISSRWLFVSTIATVSITKIINLREERLVWLRLAKALTHGHLAPSPLDLCWSESRCEAHSGSSSSFQQAKKLGSCNLLQEHGPGDVTSWYSAPRLKVSLLLSWTTNEDSSLQHMGFWETLAQTTAITYIWDFLLTLIKALYICGMHVCLLRYTRTCRSISVLAYEDQRTTSGPSIFWVLISQWPRTHPLV